MSKKTFVVGDIHGNYKGLMQAIERSKIDYQNDTLISLGDVCDGHTQTFEVVEELLKFKNLIAVKGNHDDWFLQWLRTGINPANWGQGQGATGASYLTQMSVEDPENKYHLIHTLLPQDIPREHSKFFQSQRPYYIDYQNRLFIHGGFNRHYRLDEQDEFVFYWDRDLWSQALSFESMTRDALPDQPIKFKMKEEFDEIFIGHTTTEFWGTDQPMRAANIWNLDTGGGWHGRVTIMDINTKEYYQSDRAVELYPNFKGRK